RGRDAGGGGLVATRAGEDQQVSGTGVAVVAQQGSPSAQVRLAVGAVGFADDDAAGAKPALSPCDGEPVALTVETGIGAADRGGEGAARHLGHNLDANDDGNEYPGQSEIIDVAEQGEGRVAGIPGGQPLELVVGGHQARSGGRGDCQVEGEAVKDSLAVKQPGHGDQQQRRDGGDGDGAAGQEVARVSMIDGGNPQDVERRVVAQEGGEGEGDQNPAEIA